ncbi:hypothetical protein SAMD00019534_040780 [Acytostelium subglobosum LB1]|uniref:hypothetical protein n=1 Tax=Acytostelium subglobosum LB1 TaxID=1410327 RepID=UPI000644B0E9|nr:hypothetical protein SAMD00019534_040780 [Acytostelium subglobosum LB1]GAM20903.1 hypothetical protein SAMD00019534_040780 [Acytostelium subglobosum LB1]|eukprot:XP_012756037.1 hypothetical protein SAMD00019534_040780 [Acytostelium subglobosum LB1]
MYAAILKSNNFMIPIKHVSTTKDGVSLVFNDADLFHHLGFNQDSVNPFVGGALTSANVIDLQIENILYIHSDLCSNGSDDVLQEVCTAGVPDFAYVNWTNLNLEAYSKQLVSKTKKTFYIYLSNRSRPRVEEAVRMS